MRREGLVTVADEPAAKRRVAIMYMQHSAAMKPASSASSSPACPAADAARTAAVVAVSWAHAS